MQSITINFIDSNPEAKLDTVRNLLRVYVDTVPTKHDIITCDIPTNRGYAIHLRCILNEKLHDFNEGCTFITAMASQVQYYMGMLCSMYPKLKKPGCFYIMSDTPLDIKIESIQEAATKLQAGLELIHLPWCIGREKRDQHNVNESHAVFIDVIRKVLRDEGVELTRTNERSVKLYIPLGAPSLPWDSFDRITLVQMTNIGKFIEMNNNYRTRIVKVVKDTPICYYIMYTDLEYFVLTRGLGFYIKNTLAPESDLEREVAKHNPKPMEHVNALEYAKEDEYEIKQQVNIERDLRIRGDLLVEGNLLVKGKSQLENAKASARSEEPYANFMAPAWRFNTLYPPENPTQLEALKQYCQEHGERKLRTGFKNVPGCVHAYIDIYDKVGPRMHFITHDYNTNECLVSDARNELEGFEPMEWYESICKLCEKYMHESDA